MNNSKDINFEINLLPVISLLAVLICFLLLTTAWIHIGSIDVQQAIGAQAAQKKENPPALWATMNAQGLYITLKYANKVSSSLRTKSLKGRRVWNKLEHYLARVKKQQPNMKTALISPNKKTAYKDMIKLMDKMRQHKFTEIGINPL